MKVRMGQAEAWYYMALYFRHGANWSWFRSVMIGSRRRIRYHMGMCAVIMDMYEAGLICTTVQLSMTAQLERSAKNRPRWSESLGSYLYPRNAEGDAQRVQYCLDKARTLLHQSSGLTRRQIQRRIR